MRLYAVVALSAIVACSRPSGNGNASPSPSAAPDAAVAAPSVIDAAAPAVFADGAHDYRGTLATTTGVSMHLVRSGGKVNGAYAYTKIGKPIGLEGTVAADGSVALDEFVNGAVTGHIDLHRDGASLVGKWSDLSRKKTFPLTLSPSAPMAALTGDAGAPPSANRRAEQCLADIICDAAEADRLFLAADDARDPFFDCRRFLDGVGVKKDLVRARACFERTEGPRSCEGSSPYLAIADLALLRIDGVGGPRDIAGARKTLSTCFKDETVTALLDRASAVAANPSPPAADMCKDISATTLVANDCKSIEQMRDRDRASLTAKKIAAGLDEKGRTLLRAATKAFDAYVEAQGAHVFAEFAGGSLRIIYGLDCETELETERANDLAGFATFKAATTTPDDVRSAEKDLPDAGAGPDDSDYLRELRRTFDDAQKAWLKYRDAEVALYTNVFGKAQGEALVRDAVTVRLTSRRAKACQSTDH